MSTERRLSFGNVAETYERARPSYPEELIEEVIEFADADRALEVGAGTGKATRLFAARGVSVHALEPSAEMAAIARRNCARYPEVTIQQIEFERFSPALGTLYRLVLSAQAWHWIAPEVRFVKARELLEPGGALALFWNRADWREQPLRAAISDAYRRTAPDFRTLVEDAGPMHPDTELVPELWRYHELDLNRARDFTAVQSRNYAWTSEYTSEQYVELIGTHSDHLALGPERLAALQDAVRAAIDDAGEMICLDYVTLLALGRAG